MHSDGDEDGLTPIQDFRRQTGNLGHTKTYELIADGKIEAVKQGARTYITNRSARAYRASLPRLAPKRPAQA
jgi:hypothetical protein